MAVGESANTRRLCIDRRDPIALDRAALVGQSEPDTQD
jgi:hypothetical protein